MQLKKLSTICTTLACLILTSNAFAEEQQSFVRKVLRGGNVSQSIQTRDGSYVYLNGHNVTKVSNPSGKRISEASLTFDVSYLQYVSLRGMTQTLNGFVLVGLVQDGYYGSTSAVVIKVSMEGRVVWNKIIQADKNVGFDSVIPTADGGFIVTGWIVSSDSSDYAVLIKFNSSGDIQWSTSFDSLSSSEYFLSTPMLDGGVILAADLWVDGEPKGANVIKINASGNLVWAVTLKMKEFLLQSLTALSDQGYLLAGKSSDQKLLLVRLNANGTFQSKSAYSLDVPDFFVSSLAQTPDGGIAIAGVLQKKTGAYYDSFLLKINDREKLTLQKRLGFPDTQETITSVIAKDDGSYLLFGSTWDGVSSTSDTLFVGLDSNGSTGCNFSHNLNALKVLFGNVNHKRLAIIPKTLSIFTGGSLKITSKRLTHEISKVCAK